MQTESGLDGVGLAEYIAWAYKARGKDFLVEALDFAVSLRRLAASYEELTRISLELGELGLTEVSAIVADAAKGAFHIWDCEPHMPSDCASLITKWRAEMAVAKRKWEKNSAQARS